jgi:hypothetical protein
MVDIVRPKAFHRFCNASLGDGRVNTITVFVGDMLIPWYFLYICMARE